LDHLLTQPGDFHDYYSVLPESRFTGKMEDFIKLLPPGVTPESVTSDKELEQRLETIVKFVGFSWKLDTVLAKILPEKVLLFLQRLALGTRKR
jgi:hypothetical protein